MSDFKSKLPDLKDLSSMATKLFKDLKTSVSEIIDDYKKKRTEAEPSKTKKTRPQAPTENENLKKPTAAPKTPVTDEKKETVNKKPKL